MEATCDLAEHMAPEMGYWGDEVMRFLDRLQGPYVVNTIPASRPIAVNGHETSVLFLSDIEF